MIFNSSMTFLKTTRFFAYSIVIGANLMSFAFNNRVGSKQTKKKLLSILQNGRIHAPDQFFFQNGRMPNCRESCPPFFIINQEDMIPLINKLGVLTYWLASSCTGLLIPSKTQPSLSLEVYLPLAPSLLILQRKIVMRRGYSGVQELVS